jgi:glycosyltransferase involved in cell wall biosynthesis
VETDAYLFREAPEDYLLFLGRFTEGKGVLAAIDVARRTGQRLLLAAAENDYYREQVAPLVDGRQVVYTGEVSQSEKVALLGGARALVYPVQAGESFGLVLVEAAACGTPVAALRCGAVGEIVEGDVTGMVFDSVDELVTGLPRVLALDRRTIRARAVTRFGVDRMVEGYLAHYAALIEAAANP